MDSAISIFRQRHQVDTAISGQTANENAPDLPFTGTK